MNPYATFITIYGLVVIGNRLFTYFTWKICCPLVSEIQVFNERQELINTMCTIAICNKIVAICNNCRIMK